MQYSTTTKIISIAIKHPFPSLGLISSSITNYLFRHILKQEICLLLVLLLFQTTIHIELVTQTLLLRQVGCFVF